MTSKHKPQRRKVNAKGRNKYDPHIRLHKWLLGSEAYRSLDCVARALLVELYSLYNGNNNGELFLSVREGARRINSAPNTAASRFKMLKDRGFIRPAEVGSFTCKYKLATTWILTEFEYGNQLATKDFMRWPQDEK